MPLVFGTRVSLNFLAGDELMKAANDSAASIRVLARGDRVTWLRRMLCFAVTLIWCCLHQAVCVAITLQPDESTSKDTFVYQFLSGYNFDSVSFPGTFGNLLSAGKTGSGHDTESLLQFDLSTVGLTGSQVSSATLQLHVIDTVSAGFGLSPDATHPVQIDVTAITESWSESGGSGVTWNTLPGAAGSPATSQSLNQVNVLVSFDVTNLVKQWLDGSLANNGFLLTQEAAVGVSGAYHVAVFDSSAGTVAPLLTIVPEPATAVLVLLGTAGLAIFRLRKCRGFDA
jgi:hypothetical protein